MAEGGIEQRLAEFAHVYLEAYTAAVDKHFADQLIPLRRAGLLEKYFPLYGRTLGTDCAIAAFITSASLQVFFIAERGPAIHKCIADRETPQFNQRWTLDTPDSIRKQQAIQILGIDAEHSLDYLSIPATNPLGLDIDDNSYLHIAEESGRSIANTAGLLAQRDRLAIATEAERRSSLQECARRYAALEMTTDSPQSRGIQFEKLWRDIVGTYGWHPKKFEIPGENNDFTAIYGGLHILAEVRWYQEQMHGGQMREFIAKLDPRPQTIGLFISRSGYDNGAIAVVRRVVNSKTIVLFAQSEIESVAVAGRDPGPIFLERLREVYDRLLEGPGAPFDEPRA